MIETVNNHFKSLLNNLLIKAYNEKPIYKDNCSFRWSCLQIRKTSKYDINIGHPIDDENVYFGITYKPDLTEEQEFLINKIFEKWSE